MIKRDWYIRPAVKEDFIEIYGQLPKNTAKAWALVVDNELYGIGGIALVSFSYTAFCKQAEGKKLPKTIWYKAILQGFAKIKETGVNILAVRDQELESSKRLLERLGFKLIKEGKEEVYICQQNQ
jgi:hypothetical protein